MTKAELYKKACMLPLLPGVYIIRDKSGTIIYIGKAKRLRIRVSQYFREGVPHDNKVSQMIAHAYAFDVIVCQSEFEALVLEASQIKAHTPKYNILLKDDKGYSYIKVTKDEWPRLSFTLQKEDDGAEYIGPYTSSFAARQMAETAMDAFLLPRCSRRFPQEIGRGRPCLNAHIGKCMAVCSGKISRENYEQAVKSAVHLIRYGKKDILKTLNERMLEASDRLEFETAALLRDQINAITKVTAGQKVVVDPEVEMDVVALAGTPSSVCAAVLRFREGRLTDKREFLFHDTADIAAVREEFLPRYYLDDEQIPKIIAVDELPPDSEVLQRALNEKRGSEVQLYVPQRGDKAHLVEMAHTNAVERLARESGRYAREEKLLDELAQVLGRIQMETGSTSFNPNSPKQLGEMLFDTLGLPHGKKTQRGWSTDAETLEALRDYPLVEDILQYRAYQKLNSTYVEGLLKVIGEDGRIHTRFNQTEARTGRLSSDNPNLQNIPIRTEMGSRLRGYFVAAPGETLVDADYSQIELRILAHITGDEAMQQAFLSGADIHRATAAKIYHIPESDVTHELRTSAKAINFGIMYGKGAYSLSKDIGVSVKEAEAFLQTYLATFPNIDGYMEKTIADARQCGYVSTLFGRRRALPELNSNNHNIRASGERMARNTPIQGTAADVIKLAMVRVWRRLRDEKMESRLILTVHDELIVEAPEAEAEKAAQILREEMEGCVHYAVPLSTDVHAGKNWLEAH